MDSRYGKLQDDPGDRWLLRERPLTWSMNVPEPHGTYDVVDRMVQSAPFPKVQPPSIDERLEGPRLKLARAHRHLCKLNEAVRAFIDRKPYGYTGEFYSEHNLYVLRATVREEPCAEWGVLLGEFAHNLRSALDQAVWQLIEHWGNKPLERKAGFPIAYQSDWFKRNAPTMLNGAGPGDIAVIEKLQPCYRRNEDDARRHALYVLNELWDTDKHRLLAPVQTYGATPFAPEDWPKLIANEDAGGILQSWQQNNQITAHGHVFAAAVIVPRGPNPHVGMDRDPPIEVSLSEFGLRPDSELAVIWRAVDHALREITALF